MSKITIKYLFLFLPIFASLSPVISPSVQADTLDNLLKKVMEERQFESKEFQKREQEFKTEKNQRNALLKKALQELKRRRRTQ